MDDDDILSRIKALVDEEHSIATGSGSAGDRAERRRHIEEQLDQCWDLLRQRRAKREFGENPDEAQVRDPRIVEGYQG